jgi:hypothetical protein
MPNVNQKIPRLFPEMNKLFTIFEKREDFSMAFDFA